MSCPCRQGGQVIIQKRYRIGSLVKVKNVHGGYRLPEGLPEGVEVRVVAIPPGLRTKGGGRSFHVLYPLQR